MIWYVVGAKLKENVDELMILKEVLKMYNVRVV